MKSLARSSRGVAKVLATIDVSFSRGTSTRAILIKCCNALSTCCSSGWCCSYQAEGALGRDEFKSHAKEDAAGRDAGRQSAIRGQEKRGGGLAGPNGNSTRENASCWTHRRRTRGAAQGTKGTTGLSFRLSFQQRVTALAFRVWWVFNASCARTCVSEVSLVAGSERRGEALRKLGNTFILSVFARRCRKRCKNFEFLRWIREKPGELFY